MVTDLAMSVGCVAAETGGTSAARNRKSESVDRRVIGGEFITSAREALLEPGRKRASPWGVGYKACGMGEMRAVAGGGGVGGWGGGLACWKNEATGWRWRLGALGPGLGSVRSILAGIVEAFLCVVTRSEEHTSELQSLRHLVCR